MKNGLNVILVFVAVVWTAQARAESATELLDTAGIKGGLVVHIGCGDGKFTAALHASDSYIVQGLATDSEAVMALRWSMAGSSVSMQSLPLPARRTMSVSA